MSEAEPQVDLYAILKDSVDLVFAGVDYIHQGSLPRGVRKITWSPSGDEREVYILRDEDWTGFQMPDMPSRILTLTTNAAKEDGIIDTQSTTVEFFGDLGHQVDAKTSFKLDGEEPPTDAVEEEDSDKHFADMELRKLSTDHMAELESILDALQTFDPIFVWEDYQTE